MKTHIPMVSVYITNHNYGDYIEQAIESVLNQSLQDFELIIIDDGSTDNSREIIERYAASDRVITIFQHNRGLNVSNNIALRTARGRYIMRLDADDYLDENALQVMAGVLDRDPETGLVFPDYFLVNKSGEVMEVVRRHDFDDVELLDQPAHGACTMIRRSCLLELDGYDESFSCQDGWDLWIRFVQHYKVDNVNLPLFYYRQHGGSLSGDERRILDTRAQILKRHADRVDHKLRPSAILPVRGERFDPSSLALEPLGDKLVLDWTVEAALESERVTRVAVTTPDEAIIAHLRKRYGDKIRIIERDPTLAKPNTDISGTVADALTQVEEGGDPADAFFVLYAECPFRNARHLDSAVDVMELFGSDSVIGVRPETEDFFRHEGRGMVPLRKSTALRLEREELFRNVGQMYLVRRNYFDKMRDLLGGKVGHTVLDQRASIYLGSQWELDVARFCAARMAEEGEGQG